MWQDKLKEIIYLLENSDVNEIDVNFLENNSGLKFHLKNDSQNEFGLGCVPNIDVFPSLLRQTPAPQSRI